MATCTQVATLEALFAISLKVNHRFRRFHRLEGEKSVSSVKSVVIFYMSVWAASKMAVARLSLTANVLARLLTGVDSSWATV